MKKIIPILFLIIIITAYYNKDKIVIPPNSIRFRIIANSNDLKDQQIKKELKEEITPFINSLLKGVQGKKEALYILNNNVSNIKEIVDKYSKDSIITIGNNYFPPKEYHGISIPEGNYESMVITLGNGLGENWWCILYPPLCLIDENNKEENELHLLIKDILNKYH